MLADKEYAQYLMRKQGLIKVPCPLACVLEFLPSRAGHAQLSAQAAEIKAKAKKPKTNDPQ